MKFPTNAEMWVAARPDRRAGEARHRAAAGLRPPASTSVSRTQAQTEMNGDRRAARGRSIPTRTRSSRASRSRRSTSGSTAADPGGVPVDDGRGRLRAADRVRERRQPAAVALGAPLARDRRPHRARRHALARRPAAARRERPARLHRRRARPAARARRRPPVRRRRRRTSASRTGSSSRWTHVVFGFLAGDLRA